MTAGLTSCASIDRSSSQNARAPEVIDTTSETAPATAPEPFRLALQSLRNEKYEPALELLQKFVLEHPGSSYQQVSFFNMGRALEGLERWSEAVEVYRGVVTSTSQATSASSPKLQAMALYRLSFCYEALGDEQNTVASLIDVSSRSRRLPEEVAQAELPARLAAAYARAGNFEASLDEYRRAEGGIERLRRSGVDTPDWLPRTLYFMGTTGAKSVSWESFETMLRPLARGQGYLLQAAELGVQPWAARAAADLMAIYRDLWTAIKNAPVEAGEDPLLARRNLQIQQMQRAALVMENAEELKARLAPAQSRAGRGIEARQIAAFLRDLTYKSQELLSERPAGEGLTEAALARKNNLRGQTIAPDQSLEKRFIESARMEPALSHTLPAKRQKEGKENPLPLPVDKDPNL